MANEQRPRFYTPKEIVDILTEAQRYGVAEIKLEGFEASFIVQRPNAQPARAISAGEGEGKQHVCAECGSRKLKHWQTLCLTCYRAKNGRGSREY